jgi:hypothetical protein
MIGEKASGGQDDPPVMDTLFYYLFARDAVACKAIRGVAEQVFGGQQKTSDPQAEVQQLWCLTGLIESGDLQQAEEYLKHYKPSDLRLLLCLRLGCYYVWKLRIASPEQKKIAEKLSERIAPRVDQLRKKLLSEVKGFLLEVRADEVRAVDEEQTEDGESQDPV